MDKKTSRNIRLGIFVFAGTIFLILTLYMVGSKRNLFGNTFRINATFHTVNGLTKGNNVRFAGIDVGTVERIDIINDTTVNVVMVIEEKVRKFIHTNAIAAVSTDGLMGNKLININSTPDNSPIVEEGDTLATRRPLEGDEMMRTLEVTNQNLAYITADIRDMIQSLSNTHGTVWTLLNDTILALELKKTVSSIQAVSNETKNISADISDMVARINKGEGVAGTLLADTGATNNLKQTLESIKIIGEKTDSMSNELNSLIGKINKGDGTASTLVNDTAFAADLKQTMKNIQKGTEAFSENMEALKVSWPFKKYFKKKAKENSNAK
jgi:phospholipid/cholesterol/gamma-HCH transport system substrate-binding protein